MNNQHFGFIELIGSIVLLLIDPDRRNHKKYLNPKYLKVNRITGIVTISILAFLGIYFIAR